MMLISVAACGWFSGVCLVAHEFAGGDGVRCGAVRGRGHGHGR